MASERKRDVRTNVGAVKASEGVEDRGLGNAGRSLLVVWNGELEGEDGGRERTNGGPNFSTKPLFRRPSWHVSLEMTAAIFPWLIFYLDATK